MRPRLLTSVLAGLALIGLALPAPAQAASPPPPPGLWVAATGAHQVTWAWTAVPGAVSYTVAYSPVRSMEVAKFRSVTGRWLTLTGGDHGSPTYVAVRAVTANGTTAHSVIVRGEAGAVARPNGGPKPNYDFCDWRWNPYVGAAKYLVQQSTTPTFKVNVITKVLTGRRIELPVERDSYGYLRVKPLNRAGEKITSWWSLPGVCHVPYHPVVDPTS